MRRLIGAKNSDNTQAEKEFRSQNNQWDFLVVTQVYLDESLTNNCKICEYLHISKDYHSIPKTFILLINFPTPVVLRHELVLSEVVSLYPSRQYKFLTIDV